MGDHAGDGKKGFFEGKFFNIFRDKEENAGAAADRAAKAVAEADYRAALAGMDEAAPVAEPTAQGVSAVRTPTGSAQLKDVACRSQVARVKKALKAQQEINKAQAQELSDIKDYIREAFAALDERDEAQGQMIGRALMVTSALAGVLNVNDEPTIPIALQAARALEAAEVLGWNNGGKLVKLLASVLTIVAYYDPKVGLSSLWTTKRRRRSGSGMTPTLSDAFGGLLGGSSGTGSGLGTVSF